MLISNMQAILNEIHPLLIGEPLNFLKNILFFHLNIHNNNQQTGSSLISQQIRKKISPLQSNIIIDKKFAKRHLVLKVKRI